MAKKVKRGKKNKKDLDVKIHVNNLEGLIKEGKKVRKVKKTQWASRGIGFWGFGSSLAIVLSYVKNSSIVWSIIHGIISWFYVIYRIFVDYALL